MAYQTWIADSCRAYGLPVEEYGGWTGRGSSTFAPRAALAHWTAGPCGATGRPSLHTCVNGRAGLPGPLCNVYLDRQGVCVIVAAGRANHAGTGGWRGLSGNSSVLGVEAECCHAGDWTQAQLQNYPRLLAALVAGIGRDATWIARHCDWTTRKIDTNDLSLAWLQSQAAAVLAGDGLEDDVPPAPASVAVANNIYLFARGADRHLWWSWSTDPTSGDAGWADLGGDLASGPSATYMTGYDQILVTAVGSDGAVWGIIRYGDGNFSGWFKYGGNVA